MLSKSITVVGKEFGYYTYDKKNNAHFNPCGKLPELKEVFVGLESGHITVKLAHEFFKEEKISYLDYGALYDGSGIKELTALGFEARKGCGDAFIEAVSMLVKGQEHNGTLPTLAYERLGWFQRPETNPNTGQKEIQLLFRCDKLLGSSRKARYIGPYDVKPQGDYETWRQMVIDDVIKHPALQLILVAALSSVIVGLLALRREISRPIVHTVLPSGRGKSTAAMLAVSTAGVPAHAPMPCIDEDGRIVRKQSLLGSWSSTDNALLTTNAGNFGSVMVLNELGKSLSKNLDSVVFALSDGSDKKRLTTTLQPRISDAYACTVLSNGEESLLEKCNTKLEGLAIRVLEIDSELTKDADHANRITDTCKQHYGFAAPMLAQYILDHGGYDYVNERYETLRRELRKYFDKTPSVERFIEIFVAPFMLTAELATEALQIPFDVDGLLQFLVDHEKANGAGRATSDKSYEELLEEFEINRDKFIVGKSKPATKNSFTTNHTSIPQHQIWGRITEHHKMHEDGRCIVREYEVFPTIVDKILQKYGHNNRKTCIAAWKAMGVLDYEDATHDKRKRKIVDPKSNHYDRVYVFREFASDDDNTQITFDSVLQGVQGNHREGSQLSFLLQEDELGGDVSA